MTRTPESRMVKMRFVRRCSLVVIPFAVQLGSALAAEKVIANYFQLTWTSCLAVVFGFLVWIVGQSASRCCCRFQF